MKHRVVAFCLMLSLLILSAGAMEETFSFGRFGKLTAYYDSSKVSRVVLFISGDGGWELGVVDWARTIASQGTLVIGINIRSFLMALADSKEACSYPAGDLEELSQFVQKKYGLPEYITPELIGFSSGATLVYAIMVQAPSTTFRGGISLGFCPDLSLKKPFCSGNGLKWKPGAKPNEYIFLPASTLEVPWIVLQGRVDKVCDPPLTEDFVKKVAHGEFVNLPNVGHGFSVRKNWMPQFKSALDRIDGSRRPAPEANPVGLGDLRLIEVRPSGTMGGHLLAVHITGAGGWGVTDKGIAEQLSKEGIPVAGLSSLNYFWTRRTPESAAVDLERVLRHYFQAWNKEEAILIGYSFGADALPFMYNRLPDEIKSKVKLLVLMGPSESANFELHVSSFLGKASWKDDLPTMPEIEKIRNLAVLCFYGVEDKANLCEKLASRGIKTIPIRSGHRFGSNFAPIVDAILGEVRGKRSE